MPKEVTRYEADCGGLYKTEEEALKAEIENRISLALDPLIDEFKSKIGSKNYTDNTKKFIINYRNQLSEILK